MIALATSPGVSDATPLSVPDGGPEVYLLDARAHGLDEAGLRGWARARTAIAGADGGAYVTRSYRYPYALVAWHSQPVGVDIERLEPDDAAFIDSICTPAERADLERLTESQSGSSLWSSKEALSKALGDALAYDPRRLPSPLTWHNGAAGAWRCAQLEAPSGHVAWVCWRGA